MIERAAIGAVMTAIVGLLAAVIWLGAAGFFDALPEHPHQCPAVWRSDCEAAR